MANMGYCRFENTLADLRDCHEKMRDDELSKDEGRARAAMIRLCKQIVDEYGDEIVEEREDEAQA